MAAADLQRYLDAQDGVYATVLQELQAGRKRSHWMWFIFPQLAGLGQSALSRHFAIASLDEARAYLVHPVLGGRLRACAALACAAPWSDPAAVFGPPDDLKFHSSMTLFALADGNGNGIFFECLRKFFRGKPDPATLALLGETGIEELFR
ncbi:MAG TPA: DUF1810 domain-containing protein [Noviherbaspirillum sp.]|jgi:uncharacterized protein (DUF1810 family)|uniref:DUF1810 domain-containing protein n=1 Tax=Noviherbaspirillum sp. TaxID=1926288 RepID=UPI002F939DEF